MTRWAAMAMVLLLSAGAALAQAGPATREAPAELARPQADNTPMPPADNAQKAQPQTGSAPQAVGIPGGDLAGALNWLPVITVLAIAPAIAILATCFTRVVVVLGLLRQAMTTQQVPPNQVLLGLSFLITIVAMSPVLGRIHSQAWVPYSAGKLTAAQCVEAGNPIIRGFLIEQIKNAGNDKDVLLFLDKGLQAKADLAWGDVPTPALIAGYVVSELKVAFLIGVRFFLPFVIVDMLVATVLTSMGMLMLPPVLISLPLKLLLFVLADGWTLVIGTLMKGLQVT